MKYKFKVNYPEKTVTATAESKTKNIYTATAACLPNDTFDIKKGKRIAELKIRLAQQENLRLIINSRINDEYIKLIECENKIRSLNKNKTRSIHKSAVIRNELESY